MPRQNTSAQPTQTKRVDTHTHTGNIALHSTLTCDSFCAGANKSAEGRPGQAVEQSRHEAEAIKPSSGFKPFLSSVPKKGEQDGSHVSLPP